MKSGDKKVLGVIPARWGSTRFPGKPLADIGGKPMIRHVYERTSEARLFDHVIVATDDQRIVDVVKGFGGDAVMTDQGIKTGTERVAVVSRNYPHEIIINIQGDEPLLAPQMLDDLARVMLDEPDLPVATLVKPITNYEELMSTNFARIVMTRDHRILYFTRSVIPFLRDFPQPEDWLHHHPYYRHVGIYAFRRDFLFTFVAMGPSPLEDAERLEQLRILENGYPVKGVLTTYEPHSVDNQEDLEIVRKKYASFRDERYTSGLLESIHQ